MCHVFCKYSWHTLLPSTTSHKNWKCFARRHPYFIKIRTHHYALFQYKLKATFINKTQNYMSICPDLCSSEWNETRWATDCPPALSGPPAPRHRWCRDLAGPACGWNAHLCCNSHEDSPPLETPWTRHSEPDTQQLELSLKSWFIITT